MSVVRPASPGRTRACPHCKAIILESATICPGCQHHLRFGGDPGQKVAAQTALAVEGRIKHPPDEEPWEYCVVVTVRNERGEEIARHVINVGALARAEERVVSLQVDVMPPKPAFVPARPQSQANAPPSPLAGARPPFVPPPPKPPVPPAAGDVKPSPTSPMQSLRPAKETLRPPKPGDPYIPPFGRGPRRH
jgi:hypothetical protein